MFPILEARFLAPEAELAESARAVRQLDLHTGRDATPLRVPDSARVDARR